MLLIAPRHPQGGRGIRRTERLRGGARLNTAGDLKPKRSEMPTRGVRNEFRPWDSGRSLECLDHREPRAVDLHGMLPDGVRSDVRQTVDHVAARQLEALPVHSEPDQRTAIAFHDPKTRTPLSALEGAQLLVVAAYSSMAPPIRRR